MKGRNDSNRNKGEEFLPTYPVDTYCPFYNKIFYFFSYINVSYFRLIKRTNIINFIRAQRLSWLGHIERMQGTRMVKAIYSWKPISRRPTGRPKTRWRDDVRKDIQKIKVPNWKTLAQDRRRWKELVEKAKTL